MTHWRDILARLPLPMLALSAAYGVWQFQILFTPWYVALLSASAFEITYVALAFPDDQHVGMLWRQPDGGWSLIHNGADRGEMHVTQNFLSTYLGEHTMGYRRAL